MERDSLFRETREFLIGPAIQRQVLLVAGVQYENHNEKLVTYCENRINFLWRKEPDLVCSIFDIAKGELKQKRGKKGAWATVKTYSSVSKKRNYTDKRFDKKHAGVISITDAYTFIIDIGRSAPGSLVEFSIFSHGWYGGPILVNSMDTTPTSPFRDPHDKDGRGYKDFSPANMPPADLRYFQSAFSPDGKSWMWGCNFAQIYRQVLHRIVKTKGWYKKTKDIEVFTFSFGTDFASNYYTSDPAFFPSAPTTLTFRKTVAEIKDFFRRGINYSYCQQLANAAKKPCFGGLPGTYAEPHKGGSLWIIPTKRPPQSANFSGYIGFYRIFMAMATDPEKRNYGVYM
ncbi:MAG: hypothetical protein WA004_05600 [Saprospiraceae bacterium]